MEKLEEVYKIVSTNEDENGGKKTKDKDDATPKAPGAYDIDDKILNNNEFSELMKNLFRETTSNILKELVTRKHKASKNRGSSI